jgi:hypothetical protein
MTVKQKHQKFYIFDYFLDGHFLKSQEMIAQELPRFGEIKLISIKPGVDINVKITGTEKISEDEYRIFMDSAS